ncbi:hypothetical protein [Corallincola spongiicola]|uniref:Uncharacterized protein n=1 Tax=Corallincola spongiicola TaxID=2520508 RepID=A0ABY1WSR1_9GAMM|nr:hypothetical protein [Corallincola spongiicola]TAA47608.1 hypothetical protein EXY25_10365 [Corallincola spongiicola]
MGWFFFVINMILNSFYRRQGGRFEPWKHFVDALKAHFSKQKIYHLALDLIPVDGLTASLLPFACCE